MDTRTDDPAIYIALVLAGLLPVASALVRGGAIGAGITLCMLMIAVGVIGLVSGSWRARRSRLPHARTVGRSARSQTR